MMEDELKRDIEKELMNHLPAMFFNSQTINPVQCSDMYAPIIANAIIPIIKNIEQVSYQKGIISAHKHDMLSAKSCMEANEQQLKDYLME